MKGEGYYANRVTGESKLAEAAVMTCAHCQAVLTLHSVPGQTNWKEDGGWCRAEMKPLCGPCADRALVYGCEPFLKKLEQFTDATIKYQQFIKLAGLEPAPTPRPIITGT